MSGRAGVRVATAVGVGTVGVAVVWSVLLWLNRSTVDASAMADTLAVGGQAVAWTLAGAVLVHRRPDVVIGWLLLGTGALASVGAAAAEYATRSVTADLLPGATAAAYVQSSARGMSIVPIALLLLLYPDGRLPSRRWRPFVWGSLLAVPVVGLPVGDVGAGLESYRGQAMGVDGVGGAAEGWIWAVGALLIYPALVAGAVAIVVRFRRSSGVERQQLKWAGYAGGLALGALAVSAVPLPVIDDLHHLASAILVFGLPICMVTAILRHRLYEIDRVVSRTVSYALVTVVLIGVYAAGVLGIGGLVPGGSSDLLVAGSTLTVAALFQPVRRRVQAVVDRRFNRARYDAQRELAHLAERLRRQVDVGAVEAELANTVRRVVQPASVSLTLVGGRP